jgi:hypothetical protein
VYPAVGTMQTKDPCTSAQQLSPHSLLDVQLPKQLSLRQTSPFVAPSEF